MKKIFKIYILFFVFIILSCIIFIQNVQANENENIESENISNEKENIESENISNEVQIIYKNEKIKKLNDNNTETKLQISQNTEIKIKSDKIIGSLYIKYEKFSKPGYLKVGENQYKLGENGFLHEYIEIKEQSYDKEIILNYNENVQISEIYCFTKGDVPKWVQKWKLQKGEVDLMLFSTHSDDEHLFFAGLIPLYISKGLNLQVVYLTNHNETPGRLHEQLDGLWSVGNSNYPIIGKFPDAFSESLEGAIKNLKTAGYTTDDILQFQVEQIRKYRPLVVVGHDENGEYKHGQHILNTHILKQSIVKSEDENYDERTVKEYGLWQSPKLYIHLLKQNPIELDFDKKLDYFDGKTAYEMSKIGYSYHKSQQYTWFTKWLNGQNNIFNSAKQIKTYNPTNYGLYYTSVGLDIEKNDMFENINKSNFRNNSNTEKNVLNNQKEVKKIEIFKNRIFYIVIGIFISIILLCIVILIRKKTIAKSS